jgi:collagenase-like PrtC family protease
LISVSRRTPTIGRLSARSSTSTRKRRSLSSRERARAICPSPELPVASVEVLADAGAKLGVAIEVWAYGRVPLAISARCYHARVHGLTKDSCQFVCARDWDGLTVRTLDGEDSLAVNGVQTLSNDYCNLIGTIDRLAAAGVSSLRLSPHSGDFVALTRAFEAAGADPCAQTRPGRLGRPAIRRIARKGVRIAT